MCKILGFHGKKMLVLLLTGIVSSIYISLQNAAPALLTFSCNGSPCQKPYITHDYILFQLQLGPDSFQWCIWPENEKDM